MRWIRDIGGFLAVNLFFIVAGCIAASVVWALGTVTLRAWPDATESALAWVIIGFAGVAAAIWCACRFISVISRQPRRG